MLKRLPCRGAPLLTRFYANFTKGHELEEWKAGLGERAKLREAAPRDERNIEQASGDELRVVKVGSIRESITTTKSSPYRLVGLSQLF